MEGERDREREREREREVANYRSKLCSLLRGKSAVEESKAGEGDEECQDGGSCNLELILFSWKIALRR